MHVTLHIPLVQLECPLMYIYTYICSFMYIHAYGSGMAYLLQVRTVVSVCQVSFVSVTIGFIHTIQVVKRCVFTVSCHCSFFLFHWI